MDKKELGKKAWEKTKKGISYGVGLGTGLVTTSICLAFAPQEAGRAFSIAFRAGTAGLSAVTGAVAENLATQEINLYEDKAKTFIQTHRNQNKVKVEIVK